MPKENGPGAAATASEAGCLKAGAWTPLPYCNTSSRATPSGDAGASRSRHQAERLSRREEAISDLAFHILQFAPGAEGEELEHRTALLKARDYAAWLRGRCQSERGFDHASDAHEMAGAFVFAPVPVARLEIAVAYCRCMVQAAFLAAHLDEEGADHD